MAHPAVLRPAPIQIAAGESFGLSLLSDLHVGSADTDHDAIRREVATIVERGDRVALGGDLIDAVLPKDVKRFDPHTVVPELRGRDDLLDAQIDLAIDILRPLRGRFIAIGEGNHETAVVRHHATDPTRRICDALDAPFAGYQSYIALAFQRSTMRRRFTIAYWHGAGGGSARSSCVAALEKLQRVMGDADLYWTGHRHQRVAVAMPHYRCPTAGASAVRREVWGVMTGGYLDGARYAVDRMLTLGGVGGARVQLRFDDRMGLSVEVSQ